MKIPLRALIGLENSANRALRSAIDPVLIKVGADVASAISCNSPDRALDLLDKLDLTKSVGRVLPVLEELAFSTAIFGASQSRDARTTMFVRGKNKHTSTVFKAASQMARIATDLGTKTVKKRGVQVLLAKSGDERREVIRKSFGDFCCPSHVFKAEIVKAPAGRTYVVPADVDDFSDMLNAATLGNGRLAADVAANTTTTRLAAYGYLSQAEEDGKTKFEITAVLDERTCPICTYMHGKQLDIKKALRQAEDALSADDPSDIEGISPWPGQTKDDLKDFLQMDSDTLEAEGFMVPPFHPSCRCLLVDIGEADKTIKPQSADQVSALLNQKGWFDSLLDGLLGKGTKNLDNPSDWFDDL